MSVRMKGRARWSRRAVLFRSSIAGLVLCACASPRPGGDGGSSAGPRVLDDFENAALWSAHPADGVDLALRSDEGFRGRALRLDFQFHGGGYAVVRRELDLALPENYAFSFRIRGDAPSNHLEFKLLDPSGENVWWFVRRDVVFPSTWETFTVKKRQIQFAWGPQGGGEPSRVAAIEFAVTAGSGGTGTVWLDELEIRPLPPPDASPPPPQILASSSEGGHEPVRLLDGDAAGWQASAADFLPWVVLDFGEPREYGGLVVDWEEGAHPASYAIEASDDGKTWKTVRRVEGGNGGRDYLYLPESESRFVRLATLTPTDHGIAAREIAVKPLAWSASRETFFAAIAKDAPRGAYPRGIRGEPSYWTVVGADNDPEEGLLGQDGALEIGKRQFSIEPFLYLDARPRPGSHGRFVTWADVQAEPSLEDGYLPMPSTTWRIEDVSLTVTAFAAGEAGASSLVARYRIKNARSEPAALTLYLALRPFQVNPPSQGLNTPGGTSAIRSIEQDGQAVRVNGNRIVRSLTPPDAFGATTFDGGDLVYDYLRVDTLPSLTRVEDSFEAASGALRYRLELAPGDEQDVTLLIPSANAPPEEIATPADVESSFDRTEETWKEKLDRVSIRVPASAQHALQSFRSQLGYILVNRAGPAIQPGARAYARSWIRDGSLTSSALLRLGHEEDVRAYITWFAPHQYPNGKIPCVVDARGADPVPEHDSTGEFLFLLAETFRFTGDRDFIARHWPGIVKGVAYLDSLRQTRRTDEYRKPENAPFFGILPPSISHEGYSAKPMHSYWDDFFALRGFKDAAYLAAALDHPAEAARFGAIRQEFEKDLAASIDAAMRTHGIDYIPGCADLGDFDATSTTIALSPAAADFLPRSALERTFERYDAFFRERRGGAPWEAFTPYEIRNLGAFVRLGWRDRAQELLAYFLDHQTPRAWNQWAEVVWRDTTTAHFLGDLPHTWVGSDYVRSFLDMLAYERESDSALVLAAGVPAAWIEADPGVVVRDLRTAYGPLSYLLRARGGRVEARVDKILRMPPGGIILDPPVVDGGWIATVGGKRIEEQDGRADGRVTVRRLPATVVWTAARPD